MNEESRPARRLPNDHPAAENSAAVGRCLGPPPAILIRFELEAAPQLQVDALDEHEHRRLLDWLETHPPYLRLIRAALALESEERAA